MSKPKIAILTAGGIAPCLSVSVGYLIKEYTEKSPKAEIIGYLHGYRGLLTGESIKISSEVRNKVEILFQYGGSVLGNSRVKLTNKEDCIKKGYIQENEEPLQMAAKQLIKDQITILHPIGGDDTNTTAADLVKYLQKNNYDLTFVGLPKTVDNDILPINLSLGADTAAEQGALFFTHIVNENTTNPRQLIIHEIMGRKCGWLTATTAYKYRKYLDTQFFLSDLLLKRERWDIDAIYVPEMKIDLQKEAVRLKKKMDEKNCVNIFLSEGAGLESIIAEMESKGEKIEKDAFGHIKLDKINPGQWFGKQFANMIGAEKVLVQKSGYFARSAAANATDMDLIQKSVTLAVKCGFEKQNGVIGLDSEHNNKLSCIDFDRIKGGKKFDLNEKWFQEMLHEIGQN